MYFIIHVLPNSDNLLIAYNVQLYHGLKNNINEWTLFLRTWKANEWWGVNSMQRRNKIISQIWENIQPYS